ncbi:DUF6318 family protein [Oerskovia turbata]
MGVLVVGVVVGCSSPEPVVESPPPVVEAPSPTPTPTAVGPVKPERPADMARTDEVGAAAAAVYFLELYPYVMATGDLAEWDAMTWVDLCGFCTATRDQAHEIANSGSVYVGGEIRAEVIKTYALDDLIGGYPLDVQVAIESAALLDGAGVEIDRQEAISKPYRVELLHDGANWRILTVSSEMPVS